MATIMTDANNLNFHELFSLRGRTALITGGAGHLGAAMSRAMAAAGAHVCINGRSRAPVQQLVDDIVSAGGRATAAVFDITDPAAVNAWFAERGVAPLHILVNNAYAGGSGGIAAAAPEAFQASYEITVVAAQRLLLAARPALDAAVAAGHAASIINIATMYALVSPDPGNYDPATAINPPFYGAAKAALLQWTRQAACELGGSGIRVNAISPGPFPAPAVQQADPDFIGRLAARTPLGRIGLPAEMQGPLLFLASDAASYVTGTNIVVDGGWTSW
jgi:NAD(P)-dependent dehydrogenase (short-subunit alcohol dehydrogenase family)